MIQDILNNSSLRVFHIDRECYVIFVGDSLRARRAFVRVGNSAAVPAEAQRHIEGLICTRNPLGDVAGERERLLELKRNERPYFSGTPQSLRRYKDLFALERALGTKYEPLQNIPADEPGSFLYYIDRDQVEVVIDGEMVFSLRKRATRDMHFHVRNAHIARAVAQYSSVYNATTLSRSAFAMLGSHLYLCDRGRIFGVEPDVDAYAQLARAGFDARLFAGGVHSQLGQPFLSAIMNDALRYPLRRWYFHDPQRRIDRDELERLIRFSRKRMTARITSGAFVLSFSAFALERSADDAVAGAPYALWIAPHTRCALDPQAGTWSITTEDGTRNDGGKKKDGARKDGNAKKDGAKKDGNARGQGTIIPGLPYSFAVALKAPASQLMHDYLPSLFHVGTHQCAPSETALLNACLRLLQAQTPRVMATQYTQIQRAARRIDHTPRQLTLYALYNIDTILKMRVAEEQKQRSHLVWLKKTAQQVSKVIKQISPLVEAALYLPAQVVIHRVASPAASAASASSASNAFATMRRAEEQTYVQLIKYDWNRSYGHVAHDASIRQRIVKATAGAGQEYHREEQARLLRLLAEMEAAEREREQAAEKAAKEAAARQQEQAAERAAAEAAAAAATAAEGVVIAPGTTETPGAPEVAGATGAPKTRAHSDSASKAAGEAFRRAAASVISPRKSRSSRIGSRIALGIGGGVAAAALIVVLLLSGVFDPDPNRNGISLSASDTETSADGAQSAADASADEQFNGTDAPAGISPDATPEELQAHVTDNVIAPSDFRVSIYTDRRVSADVYLEIESPLGAVTVTLAEVIAVVNRIARDNGFRELGVEDVNAGPDPDLIYPFDQLTLPPHSEKYQIVANDSIWLVSLSLIENQIKDFLSQLAAINAVLDEGAPRSAEKDAVLAETIDTIVAESYSASLREIARQVGGRL